VADLRKEPTEEIGGREKNSFIVAVGGCWSLRYLFRGDAECRGKEVQSLCGIPGEEHLA